jgi:menaquinone-dependent protoporphyrinogen oxidase
MPNKILVTYASRAGSTVGVAEAIGQTLSDYGGQVEVRPMQDVKDLAPYQAVVAGSAIQGGEWLPEAMQFMRTHQAMLAQKPFAAFLVCMTMSVKNPTFRQGVAGWLKPVRALVKPVSEGYFAGALDISKMPSFGDRLKFRISVALGVWSEGDHRDWDAIHTWARNLKPVLEA